MVLCLLSSISLQTKAAVHNPEGDPRFITAPTTPTAERPQCSAALMYCGGSNTGRWVLGATVVGEVRSCLDHGAVWYTCPKGVDTQIFS